MENKDYTGPVTSDTLWLTSTLGQNPTLTDPLKAPSKLTRSFIPSLFKLSFFSNHITWSPTQEKIFVHALTQYARIWYNYHRIRGKKWQPRSYDAEESETASKPTDGLAQHDFCPGLAAAAYLWTTQGVMGVCCTYLAAVFVRILTMTEVLCSVFLGDVDTGLWGRKQYASLTSLQKRNSTCVLRSWDMCFVAVVIVVTGMMTARRGCYESFPW